MIHWSSSTIGRFIDESGKESSTMDDTVMGQVILFPQNIEDYGISHQSSSKNLRNRTSINSNASDDYPSLSITDEISTVDSTLNDQTIKAQPKKTLSNASTSNDTLSSKIHVKIGRSSTEAHSPGCFLPPKSPSEHARRGSAPSSIEGQHFNIPKWLYEDVPDPDSHDWGDNLGGLIGLFISEKAKSTDPRPIELEVIREADQIVAQNVHDKARRLTPELVHQRSYQDSDGYLVPPGLGFIDSEVASLNSVSSLPIHPNYVGPVFRSIPTWIPIRPIYIASFMLIFTVTLNIMIIASSIRAWGIMPNCSDENRIPQ